jgi:thiamine-monophosphate kinase
MGTAGSGSGTAQERPGEFELIASLFAPLTRGFPGAYGLEDGAAYLALTDGLVQTGEELVLKTDALIAGVHFLEGDPGDVVARKLLRVNLSDLAAKGARPIVYMLAAMLPASLEYGWLQCFAEGLKADQDEFGIVLAGGDTDATPGPLTLSLSVIGAIPAGQRLLRSAAKVGDAVFVTGTIGDGALGLAAILGQLTGVPQRDADFLADRYRLPRPRLELGKRLRGLVHATMDISDGLVGDLQHICDASHVGATIEIGRLPLSNAAKAAITKAPTRIDAVIGGGDDYELLFTAPPSRQDALASLGLNIGVPITRIGTIDGRKGVRVIGADGQEIVPRKIGYRHF